VNYLAGKGEVSVGQAPVKPFRFSGEAKPVGDWDAGDIPAACN